MRIRKPGTTVTPRPKAVKPRGAGPKTFGGVTPKPRGAGPKPTRPGMSKAAGAGPKPTRPGMSKAAGSLARSMNRKKGV